MSYLTNYLRTGEPRKPRKSQESILYEPHTSQQGLTMNGATCFSLMNVFSGSSREARENWSMTFKTILFYEKFRDAVQSAQSSRFIVSGVYLKYLTWLSPNWHISDRIHVDSSVVYRSFQWNELQLDLFWNKIGFVQLLKNGSASRDWLFAMQCNTTKVMLYFGTPCFHAGLNNETANVTANKCQQFWQIGF